MQRGAPSFERLDRAVGRLERQQIGARQPPGADDDRGGWAIAHGETRASIVMTALALSIMRTRPIGSTLRPSVVRGVAYLQRQALAPRASTSTAVMPPITWAFLLLGMAVATRPWDATGVDDAAWHARQRSAIGRCLFALAAQQCRGGGWPGSAPFDGRPSPTVTARTVIALANAADHGWLTDPAVGEYLRAAGGGVEPVDLLRRGQARLVALSRRTGWAMVPGGPPSVAATALATLALARARRAGVLLPAAQTAWAGTVAAGLRMLLASAHRWSVEEPVEHDPWEHRRLWHHPVHAFALRACLEGGVDPLDPALRGPIDELERRWDDEEEGWRDAVPYAGGRVTVVGTHAAATTLESLRRAFGVLDPIALYRAAAPPPTIALRVRDPYVVSMGGGGAPRIDAVVSAGTYGLLRAFAEAAAAHHPRGVTADRARLLADLRVAASTLGTRIDRANDQLRGAFGDAIGIDDVLRQRRGVGHTIARLPITTA